jgi:ketosteroid isomerase-like protein
MSRETVEVVRRAIEASRSGDPDANSEVVVALSDPRFEFKSVLNAVEGATYRGHHGIRRYFHDMADAWQEWRNEADEVLDIEPDTVFADIHFRAIGQDSGVAVEARTAVVFVLSQGKLLSIHSYPTRAEALEAVGLRE